MRNTNMRILVIRTSAMGDVALTAPVITSFLNQYPNVELVMITRSMFKPFFTSTGKLSFFFPDFKKRHKGIIGVVKLFNDINKDGEISYVIDLHNVLRSKILRLLFRLGGIRSAVIDKGRSEKLQVTSGKNKKQLKHSVERYSDTFYRAGFPLIIGNGPWIIPSLRADNIKDHLVLSPDEINIGVAPFAKHKLKMWPEENMIHLLHLISHKKKCKFWLFGGPEDSEKMRILETEIPESVNLAGKITLDQELAIMSRLDFMIAMDSSNMHMAALLGIKVISIWGGTDPITGFGAYGQPEENFMKIPFEELSCRPCTVFGKGTCHRGDFACMEWLSPEKVFMKMINLKII